jgi:hypothetical protein
VLLPALGIGAAAISCELLPVTFACAAATGALCLLRVGLQPWYSDLPLAGFGRWVTAVFLALAFGGGVAVAGVVVAIFSCAD